MITPFKKTGYQNDDDDLIMQKEEVKQNYFFLFLINPKKIFFLLKNRITFSGSITHTQNIIEIGGEKKKEKLE